MSAKEDGTELGERDRGLNAFAIRDSQPSLSFSRKFQVITVGLKATSLDNTRVKTLTYFAVEIDYQFLLYMRYPVVPRLILLASRRNPESRSFPS